MPRSRTLLIVGLLALVAGATGGLLGAHELLSGPSSAQKRADARLHARVSRDVTKPGAVERRAAAGARTAPGRLPKPTLFVASGGDDGGACTAAAPCKTFDRAYHLARPGQVVQLAGGRYGTQTITHDGAKTDEGCESDGMLGACVILAPAPGAHVQVDNLNLGATYGEPGPAALALVAGSGRTLETNSTNFNQVDEVSLWGLTQHNIYMAGGQDIGIRGGAIGDIRSADGTHPEIQRVYGSDPVIVPTRLTIEGVRFHDINTTSPTAHVDCLQIENADDVVIRGNTFERCGSVGLRMSYGSDSTAAPPQHVLIEDNHFGRCAATPVSECYYSAQLGVGKDVLVRRNTSEQAFQSTGGEQYASRVRYVRNLGPGVTCEAGISYVGNVWVDGACSKTDRQVGQARLEAALRRRLTG
jgi:hypothetical protein